MCPWESSRHTFPLKAATHIIAKDGKDLTGQERETQQMACHGSWRPQQMFTPGGEGKNATSDLEEFFVWANMSETKLG